MRSSSVRASDELVRPRPARWWAPTATSFQTSWSGRRAVARFVCAAATGNGRRQGEKLLSRDVCPVAKTAAALPKMDPQLWDRLDLLVIPGSCDAKKKLADALRRHKAVHVMDVPAVKDSEPGSPLLARRGRAAGRTHRAGLGSKDYPRCLGQAVRLSMRRESSSARFWSCDTGR